MEKRLLLAIALSVLVLLAWSYLFPPPPRPVPVSAPAPTQPAVAAEDPPRPESEAAEAAPVPEEAPAEAASEDEITVTNELFEVRLTNRGGRVRTWHLLKFETSAGAPLDVWPRFTDDEFMTLGLELDDAALAKRVNEALYEVTREPLPDGERIVFNWSDGAGTGARKSLAFRHGSYLVDVAAEVRDRGRARTDLRLALGPGFAAQESRSGQSNYYYSSQLVWNRAGFVTRLKATKLDVAGGLEGAVRWAGLEDQFFCALVVPDAPAKVTWRPIQKQLDPEVDPQAEPALHPLVAVSIGSEPVPLYVGPKQFTLLRTLGHDLEQVVWFSDYGWLAAIVKYLYLALVWLHDHVAHNYGLAIVLATVALRVVLFPVNQFAMVSMRKSQLQMQRLQPKIKAIRNKYKKVKDAQTRAKMNQEMMDLYRAEGVNPAGGLTGCIPLLAQFPILIGFYNMLTVAVELRGAPFFGWIQDLSVRDPLYVTPILMGVTMFAQQYMSMPKVKDPQQLQQQRIMMFMPVMFVVICLQMPAGLVLYWFVNNLLGIGQQWLVNRHTVKLEQ